MLLRTSFVVVLALVLSGCSSPGGPQPTPDPRPTLADRKVCAFVYPDAKPVDCTRDDAINAALAPPENWRCIKRLFSPSQTSPLGAYAWSDLDRHVGIQYLWGADPRFNLTGLATLSMGAGGNATMKLILFHGPGRGFIGFSDALPNRQADLEISLWHFSASGEPSFLNTTNLRSRATLWHSSPFIVWSFVQPDATYHFKSPSSPPGSESFVGRDHSLNVTSVSRSAMGNVTIPTLPEYLTAPDPCRA